MRVFSPASNEKEFTSASESGEKSLDGYWYHDAGRMSWSESVYKMLTSIRRGKAWHWSDLRECCSRPVSLPNLQRSHTHTHTLADVYEPSNPALSHTHTWTQTNANAHVPRHMWESGDCRCEHACAHKHTCAHRLSSALYWITLILLALIGLGLFWYITATASRAGGGGRLCIIFRLQIES